MAGTLSISVDLDEIHHYSAIHGLAAPPAHVRHVVRHLAMERILGWTRAEGITLTLFVVGADTSDETYCEHLRRGLDQGLELANHSYAHDYRMSTWPMDKALSDIGAGQRALKQLGAKGPFGFRAPGYTLSPALVSALEQAKVAYDSSVFPCPGYLLSKGAVLAMATPLARVDEPKRPSMIGDPRAAMAPRQPYWVHADQPFARSELGTNLREVPIYVTPFLRLPTIGTAISLGPDFLWRRLLGQIDFREHVAIELHGIDFLDAGDGLDFLRGYQPDISVPWRKKQKRYSQLLQKARSQRAQVLTLKEQARISLG